MSGMILLRSTSPQIVTHKLVFRSKSLAEKFFIFDPNLADSTWLIIFLVLGSVYQFILKSRGFHLMRAVASLVAYVLSIELWLILKLFSLISLILQPVVSLLWAILNPLGVPSAVGYFVTEHRSWLVLFVVAPLSKVFDFIMRFRAWYIETFLSAPELHNQRVAGIVAQVKAWRDKNDGTKLCTARPGWMSIAPGSREYKKTSTCINIDLHDILHLDTDAMTVTVEPMVNMGQISHFLVAKGFTLPLVPEMDDLTVGGLTMGVGIEGSSHIYGLMDDIVVSYDVVLADGRVVTASKDENEDLFRALPWSYGTLGFLVAVRLRIVPCKVVPHQSGVLNHHMNTHPHSLSHPLTQSHTLPCSLTLPYSTPLTASPMMCCAQSYVRLTSYPCHTHDAGVRIFSEKCTAAKPSDFVESLAYSFETSVVMTGDMVDKVRKLAR